VLRKLEKLLAVDAFLDDFTDFMNETSWNKRFEVPLAVFLEMCIDPNLKLFMEMQTRGDLLADDKDGSDQDRKALYSPANMPSNKVTRIAIPANGHPEGKGAGRDSQPEAIELV